MVKLPLKGSKEYRALVTATGLLIGLGWVAKDEYENPKWTGIPKAASLGVEDLHEWNKQFGPADLNKWAIPASENTQILESLSKKSLEIDSLSGRKDTW